MAVVIGVWLGLNACKEEIDAEAVAEGLANRILESLDFDQPTTLVEKPLPAESPDGPVISEAIFPEVGLDDSPDFTVTLEVDPETEIGDVVQTVVGSKKDGVPSSTYLLVDHETSVENRFVTVSGSLAWNEETAGEKFELLFALKNKEGLVGSYVTWLVTAPEYEPVPWTDAPEELTWQNPPEVETMSWEEAVEYCDNLELEGADDWRMPTIDELRSLIRDCWKTETDGFCNISEDDCLEMSCRSAACDGCEDDEGPQNGRYWPVEIVGSCMNFYWSSTLRGDDELSAWLVTFYDGGISHNGIVQDDGSVRCVRSEQ